MRHREKGERLLSCDDPFSLITRGCSERRPWQTAGAVVLPSFLMTPIGERGIKFPFPSFRPGRLHFVARAFLQMGANSKGKSSFKRGGASFRMRKGGEGGVGLPLDARHIDGEGRARVSFLLRRGRPFSGEEQKPL